MDNSERKININEESNLKRIKDKKYIEDLKNRNEINKEKKKEEEKKESNIAYIELEEEKETTIEEDKKEYEKEKKIDKYIYRKKGRCYFFFGDKDGNPLFIIGPQWYMYIILTLSVNSFILFYSFSLIPKKYNLIFKLIGLITLFIFQISYSITFLINPGYPLNTFERKFGEPRSNYRMCIQCNFWVKVDENVVHCSDCKICIEGYDHHCPWTSKCIGKNNIFFFHCFVGSICFAFFYFFALICLIIVNKEK